jgi:CRISP-associated protein Cas1
MALVSIVTDVPVRAVDLIYDRQPANDAVVIADGFGISVRVRYGQLEIEDGIGRKRRTRVIPATDRTVKRLYVNGHTGSITLEALRWCHVHGITLATISPTGELIDHHANDDVTRDVTVLRSQVMAQGSTLGLEIAREIESRKLAGQSANVVRHFSAEYSADRIDSYRAQLESAATAHDVMGLEGIAAAEYFRAWRRVRVRWDDESIIRIPSDWEWFHGRESVIKEQGKRNATDPVNALLNYCYTLGYIEARNACALTGLDSRIGFVHSDKIGRDSLACDIVEMFRERIDSYVLDLIKSRVFTYRDFSQQRDGTVRINAPLVHELIEVSHAWHVNALDAARLIARMLTGGTVEHARTIMRERNRAELADVDDIMPDKIWSHVAPLIPVKNRDNRGRPSTPNRSVIAAMVWCETRQAPWTQVPVSLGVSPRTIIDRRKAWIKSDHWPAIDAEIQRLASR